MQMVYLFDRNFTLRGRLVKYDNNLCETLRIEYEMRLRRRGLICKSFRCFLISENSKPRKRRQVGETDPGAWTLSPWMNVLQKKIIS